MSTFADDTKHAMMLRAGYLCEVGVCCAGFGVDCTGHHRQPKGSGGTSDPDRHHITNGLYVCGLCHGWIHDHPDESRDNGWIVSLNGIQIPSNVPVEIVHKGLVLLSEDGGYQDPAPTFGDRADHELGLADHETALAYDETARGLT